MGRSRRPKRRSEPTPAQVNPGAFVLFPLSMLGAMAALVVLMDVIREHEPSSWIAAPIMLTVLFSPLLFMVYAQLAHAQWVVSESTITTIQPGRGVQYERALPNQHFSKVQPLGPLVIVHHYSGKRYIWPRWLRHAKRTYTFELYYDRVRLKPLGSQTSSPTHAGRRD